MTEVDNNKMEKENGGEGRLRSVSRAKSFLKEGVGGHLDKDNRSPFVKHEEEELGTKEWAMASFFSFFVNSIPMASVKKLKPNRLIFFGLIAYAVVISLFLGFAISGYVQSRQEEFVSLNEDAGICNEVEKPLAGTYFAATNGKWEGDPDFAPPLAAYQFDFASLKVNDAEFAAEIVKLHDVQLTTIGANQAVLGIHVNLLFWMHFSAYFTVGGKVQSLSFTAHPGDVFNREYMEVKLSNANAICDATAAIAFEPILGGVALGFDMKDDFSDDCKSIVTPTSLGYDEDYDGDTFTFDMDLVSLTSALSVNIGILEKSHLQSIGEPFFRDFGSTGQNFSLQRFYDPRFPRMSSLFCFHEAKGGNGDDTDTPTDFLGQCLLLSGEQLLIPVLIPYYKHCLTCEASTEDFVVTDDYYGGDNLPLCTDIFDLVVGYIYFDEDNFDSTINLLNKFANQPPKAILEAAHGAYQESNFTFCDDKCSLIVVNTYDSMDQFVSPHFFSLTKGHCEDSTEKESFLTLAENPPTDLVEEYYRCKNSKSASFFKSVGIANSNMLFFSPFIFFFILTPLINSYHKYVVKEEVDPDEFNDEERDKAMKVFSTQLMRMAQSKEHRQPDPDRVIAQLAVELNQMGTAGESKASAPL